jgi:K+-sensing histidine kinase KdpD
MRLLGRKGRRASLWLHSSYHLVGTAYNFFFIPPLYTFTIAEPYELLALLIFLVLQ